MIRTQFSLLNWRVEYSRTEEFNEYSTKCASELACRVQQNRGTVLKKTTNKTFGKRASVRLCDVVHTSVSVPLCLAIGQDRLLYSCRKTSTLHCLAIGQRHRCLCASVHLCVSHYGRTEAHCEAQSHTHKGHTPFVPQTQRATDTEGTDLSASLWPVPHNVPLCVCGALCVCGLSVGHRPLCLSASPFASVDTS